MFKSLALLASLIPLAQHVQAGALPSGVCYSPWHHSTVNADVVGKDFAQMKQFFSQVRTYHASFAGVNVVDAAAAAGVKVAVGIQMGDASGIQKEIQAACDGAKRHPQSVAAVYVGNENVKNGNFGKYSVSDLVGYINQLKSCTSGLGIKIGTVQRINEWLDASDIATLAGACDTIGVNIYPFFTSGSQRPIDKLNAQWTQMTKKYAENKLALTETGWPRQGESSFGNVPSKETTQNFLEDFAEWSKSRPNSYFFMMYDTTVSYSGQQFEKFFGLANTQGTLQVTIPGGSGAYQTPATSAPASTPASTPATTSPKTQAPPTSAPAATTASPKVVPAPTSASPVVTSVKPAPGSAPAPGQVKPAPGPGPAPATPAATTASPAATTKSPAQDPSQTAGESDRKKKKKHCK